MNAGSGREDCNDSAVCIEYSCGSRESINIIGKILFPGLYSREEYGGIILQKMLLPDLMTMKIYLNLEKPGLY